MSISSSRIAMVLRVEGGKQKERNCTNRDSKLSK